MASGAPRGGNIERCLPFCGSFQAQARKVWSPVPSPLPFFLAPVDAASAGFQALCFSLASRTCHKTEPLRRGDPSHMEAAPASVVFAVDEKVLVGDNQHQAYVARPVREGDDTVLVRWESTGAREEVAVGDAVGKNRSRGQAPSACGARLRRRRRERASRALPSAPRLHEEIERRTCRANHRASAGSLAKKTPTAPRSLSGSWSSARGSLYGRSAAAAALAKLTGGWHQTAARTAAITEAGGIPPLVALVLPADGSRRSPTTTPPTRLRSSRPAALRRLWRSGNADRQGGCKSGISRQRRRRQVRQQHRDRSAARGAPLGRSSEDQGRGRRMSELAYSADAMKAAIAAGGGIGGLVALATTARPAVGGRAGVDPCP